MAFADRLKKLDAHRLQQSVKATIQANGRLTFTVEATKEMKLSEDKSLVIFEADGGDLGVTISVKDDPEAFVLKRCGAYYYVAFKNYLQQAGIDYKNQRIIYDISELDEKIDGKTLYQFSRRVLPKSLELLPTTDITNGGGNGDGSGEGQGSGSGAGNGDGSGEGRGAGAGAGNGDGSGAGQEAGASAGNGGESGEGQEAGASAGNGDGTGKGQSTGNGNGSDDCRSLSDSDGNIKQQSRSI